MSQYSTLLAQQADVSGTPMSDLPAWVRSHLTERLNVNVLAKAVAMTPRTFARQFESHFKATPARWVQALRVEAACERLVAEDLPLKVVARLTGFRDEKSLRRALSQHLAMSPKIYRTRFGMRRGDAQTDLAPAAHVSPGPHRMLALECSADVTSVDRPVRRRRSLQ